MTDCKSCGVQALVEDDYCLSCRRFKDHLTAVNEKIGVQICKSEWVEGGECDGIRKFHDRYWRIGFDDDDEELRRSYPIHRLLLTNVWICEKCGDVCQIPQTQKTIDEYKQKQESLKSKVSK